MKSISTIVSDCKFDGGPSLSIEHPLYVYPSCNLALDSPTLSIQPFILLPTAISLVKNVVPSIESTTLTCTFSPSDVK